MAAADKTEREKQRALLILAIQSLSDALWKESLINDEQIALQCLHSGADSAKAILS